MTRGTMRLMVILLGSYLFYGWWDWRFLSLIILSTCCNFWAGSLISATSDSKFRKIILWTSIVGNIGLLGVFKYLNFFRDTVIKVFEGLGFNPDIPTLSIILPVGISFFTFQALSYVIDIYRGNMEAEPKLLRFAVYISLFPQLVAGPIVRASQLLPELRIDHKLDMKRILIGIEMILIGYFLKVVVSDSLAPIVDLILSSPSHETSLSLMVAVSFFAFQIYCDFNGYSLIAIGLGKMLGFDFGQNFNRPYFSASFSEFWTRWHISLSSWLRDYLYIPLGGNKHGRIKTFRNLVLTMLLGGLWHGASWNFVIWGALHGFYLVMQRIFSSIIKSLKEAIHTPLLFTQQTSLVTFVSVTTTTSRFLSRPLLILLVFGLTCFSWIFFRAPDLQSSLDIIFGIYQLDDLSPLSIPSKFLVLKGVLLIMVILSCEAFGFWLESRNRTFESLRLRWLRAMLILWSIPLLGTFKSNSFIYFQF